MMALFIWAIAAMNVTMAGRRVSARYINYTGLYELALAGSEKALFVIREQVADNANDVAYDVKVLLRQQLDDFGIENHVVYQNGQFYLFSPFYGANRLYLSMYQRAMNRALGIHDFTYTLYVGDINYNVAVDFTGFSGDNATVETRVGSNRATGRVTHVDAQIRWPAPSLDYRELLIPVSYIWRNDPPAWFLGGVDGLDHIGYISNLPIQSWAPEHALWVGNQSQLNIQHFYVNGIPIPTIIVHTGTTPLRLYSNGLSQFEGVIVSNAGVILDGIIVRGTVIADIVRCHYYDEYYYDCYYNGCHCYSEQVEICTEMLFAIPLPEESRRMVFDFLGLTRFGDVPAGEREVNIARLLGELQICYESYKLDISPIMELPEMDRLLRVIR